jgi:exodeoxyribonuclease VII large subunit
MNITNLSHNTGEILSVSELNYNAKILIEQAIPLRWVGGEISNLKRYQSGHWYFSLKDANAQVRCVMFRHKNQYLDWQPNDGMQVEVRAIATIFEPRGDFQLNVETIRRAGQGSLYAAFEQLKARLLQAGLFDPDQKKPLPAYPKQIGIITSPSAAALLDVLSTLKHRMPSLPIIIYPTQVQGAGAAAKIVDAIQIATTRAECDALILCRGGGSIEDLWAFNAEIVAHAIAACPIPIISAVGHETDITIADFVADIRAPTPTGAAQLICQDTKELLHRLSIQHNRIKRVMQHTVERLMQKIDMMAHRLLHPGEKIYHQQLQIQRLHDRLFSSYAIQLNKQYQRLREINHYISTATPNVPQLIKQQHQTAYRLNRAMTHRIETSDTSLQRLKAHLMHLNPHAVLARGYSISYTADGMVIHDSNQIAIGDNIQVILSEGWCRANVSEKNKLDQ